MDLTSRTQEALSQAQQRAVRDGQPAARAGPPAARAARPARRHPRRAARRGRRLDAGRYGPRSTALSRGCRGRRGRPSSGPAAVGRPATRPRRRAAARHDARRHAICPPSTCCSPSRRSVETSPTCSRGTGPPTLSLSEALTRLRGDAARHLGQPGEQLPGAGEVRRRPHRARPRGRDGPGHRSRRRDPPGGAGAGPPHQEQPGPHRRARASARPPSSRGSPSASSPATYPSRCAASGSCPSTSRRWWRARSTAASSRSG